jgi:hypothetical protein
MPSVNLRLSDEQHAELVAAGQRENRSLQREIIYRLFGRFNQGPTVRPTTSSSTHADAESRDVRARTLEPVESQEDHFKPDFKPERKKR